MQVPLQCGLESELVSSPDWSLAVANRAWQKLAVGGHPLRQGPRDCQRRKLYEGLHTGGRHCQAWRETISTVKFSDPPAVCNHKSEPGESGPGTPWNPDQ